MKFSVLLSVYKDENAEYFSRALQSVWDDQTHKPSQIVLVKDGPLTCELDKVLEMWVSQIGDLITIVSLPHNKGLGAALNEGLKSCRYQLVARMDADDICLPERFEKQIRFIESDPSIDILGASIIELDELDRKGSIRAMPLNHNEIYANIWTCPIIHPAVMFRRDKILGLGGYNAKLRRRQDYELWFRCAKAGLKFANINEALLLYRFNQNTHRKQPIKLAFEQGYIGFRGASMLNLPIWTRFGCFVPFLRSLVPSRFQHAVYSASRYFDPRKQW